MARLPPLNAIRVFEAAARHLSFTRAARELCVTQGAVSQQVKGLEEALGVRLFLRVDRGLKLTEEGRTYAEELGHALRQIEEATGRVRAVPAGAPVTLTCLPSFAHKWLIPRLATFEARNPEVPLRLHTSFEVVDLARAEVDCAIRNGAGGYDGLYSEILLTEELTPMAAPDVASRLRQPRDLNRETLLQDYGTDWREWLEVAGLQDLSFRMGAQFLDSSAAMDAAIEGRGVILGHTVLAASDIEKGRLVAPFPDLRMTYDCPHWFVCLPGHQDLPRVRPVLEWLREEAASFQRLEVRLGRVLPPRAFPFR